MVGFLAGADLTSHGLIFGNDGLIAGVTAGYVSSNLTLNTSSLALATTVNNRFSRLHANLSGPTAGLYATYFNGGFSTDLTLKVDVLNLNETFNEVLGFNTGEDNLGQVPFAGDGSVPLLNATVPATSTTGSISIRISGSSRRSAPNIPTRAMVRAPPSLASTTAIW